MLSLLLFIFSANSVYANSIKVIGAGLGRTGTLSLAAALDILGFKSYHYIDFNHAHYWADFASNTSNGTTTADDLIDLIVNSGFDATFDNPCADLYEDQLRRFPDAKVILSIRDSADVWEKSFKNLFDTMTLTERPFSVSFPSFFQWIPLFRHLKTMRCVMGTTHLGLPPCELTRGWRNKPDGWLASQYQAHNAHVMATVASEQLLVYNAKEGWGPLCSFLKKDVPDAPFPHVRMNGTAELQRLRVIFLAVIYGWIPSLVLIVASLGWCIFGKSRRRNKAKKS